MHRDVGNREIPGAGPPKAALRYQPLVVRSLVRFRQRLVAINTMRTSAEARHVLCERAFLRHQRLVARLCFRVASRRRPR